MQRSQRPLAPRRRMLFAETEPATNLAVGQIWMPLAAAMLFAWGALLIKRTADWSIDVWRTTFVSNMTSFAAFLPLLLFPGEIPSWTDLWQPLVVGGLFILGQVTTMLALTRGEVSIAAPVLGLKIVMVAIFAALFTDEALPANIWWACGLATLGVVLLNVSDNFTARGGVWLSVVCAGAAAAAFAGFDIGVQEWSPAWGGTGRFLPLVFTFGAIGSLPLMLLFEDRLTAIPRPAWPWLAGGAALIALQSLGIVLAIALFGKAPVANVFYSTRGLWGVVLVWLCGSWLGVSDASLRGWVVYFRIAGAAVLMAAIGLLLI